MTLPITNQNVQGNFLPTSFIVDVAVLNQTDVNSPEFKELLVRRDQTLTRICISINGKESGYFPLNEFVTGQLYFPNPATNTTGMEPLIYSRCYANRYQLWRIAKDCY